VVDCAVTSCVVGMLRDEPIRFSTDARFSGSRWNFSPRSADAAPTKNMIHKNADIVRRGYHAFNTADLKTLSELFDSNASWHTPGKSSTGGLRKGQGEIFALFGRYGGETNGTFKAELKTVCADEEGRVVGVHHNSGVRNGKVLATDCCITFELKDGRVVSGKEYFFDLANWDAFWA
jgi:ketosteroid isomerase-like protein